MQRRISSSSQPQASLPLGQLPDAVLLQIAQNLDPSHLLAFASSVPEARKICCAEARALTLSLPETKQSAQFAAQASFAGAVNAWRAAGGVDLVIQPHYKLLHGRPAHGDCSQASHGDHEHGCALQTHAMLPPLPQQHMDSDMALAAFLSRCISHQRSAQSAVRSLQLKGLAITNRSAAALASWLPFSSSNSSNNGRSAAGAMVDDGSDEEHVGVSSSSGGDGGGGSSSDGTSGEGGDCCKGGTHTPGLLSSIRLRYCQLHEQLQLSRWCRSSQLRQLDITCPGSNISLELAQSLSHLTALTSLELVCDSWETHNQGTSVPSLSHGLTPLTGLHHLGLSAQSGLPHALLPSLPILPALTSLALQHHPRHPVLEAVQYRQLNTTRFPALRSLQLGTLAQLSQLLPLLSQLPLLRHLSVGCIGTPNASLARANISLDSLTVGVSHIEGQSQMFDMGLFALSPQQLRRPLSLGLLRLNVHNLLDARYRRQIQGELQALKAHYAAYSTATSDSTGTTPMGHTPSEPLAGSSSMQAAQAQALQPTTISSYPPPALAMLGCNSRGEKAILAAATALTSTVGPHITHLCLVGGNGATPQVIGDRSTYVTRTCLMDAGRLLGQHITRLDLHVTTLRHFLTDGRSRALFPRLSQLGIINAFHDVRPGDGPGLLVHTAVAEMCDQRPLITHVLLLGRPEEHYKPRAAAAVQAVRAALKAKRRQDVIVKVQAGLELAR